MSVDDTLKLKKLIRSYCLQNDIKKLYIFSQKLGLYAGSDIYIRKFLTENRPMSLALENKLRKFFGMSELESRSKDMGVRMKVRNQRKKLHGIY